MPSGTAGTLFATIAGKAEERAKENRAKSEKDRDSQIGLYSGVLKDINSSPEQRSYAAERLDKLYNVKKGESPFQKIVKFLNHTGDQLQGKAKEAQAGGQAAPGGEAKPAAEGQGQPKPLPSLTGDPHISPGKKNLAEKALGKVSKGLGATLGAVGGALSPDRGMTPLPPMNAAAFPTAEQKRANEVKDVTATNEAAWPWEEKKIRLQEELRQTTARDKAQNAMQAKTKYPGSSVLNALPEAERRAATDVNGLPLDPNGLYGPANGKDFFVDYSEQGHPVLMAVRVGTGSERESTTEQLVIDPKTNMLMAVPLRRTSKAPEPPKKDMGNGETPKLKTRGEQKTLSPINGNGKAAGGSKSAGGARVVGPYVRPQQFNVLQKQANAINEARNSLVGDNPDKIEGIAADLEIFKNPQSVKRLSEYIGFINQQLDRPAKDVTGQGAWAAAEWYAGLPQTVNELQQEALRKVGEPLNDQEQKFVADYYRLIGTIGGLRAATGASAARWSFQNLRSEVMTPGVVTGYSDAKRRLKNLVQETNVVSKHNTMVESFDVNRLDDKGGVQKWGRDLQGNPVPLPAAPAR
jgi:hypothetical protein